jgi:phospho-N-acetylmuramoyl-pentapeptide-transferase
VYGAGDGLKLRYRLAIILALSSFVGWWFYTKLAMVTITVPFVGAVYVGMWIIPLFVAVSLVLYASGVIDGIDGLSGGVFASIFASYAIIAFSQSQYDIAALCASILGGVLAFLWFNIPPARFYMTETGTMALTLVLATIAFMTDALGEGIGLSVLPIIGFLLFVTVASNIIQVFSKKVLGRKVFRIAPLHHHFEAIGWPSYKVTMRYWVLSVMCAFVGVVFALLAA